MVIFGVLLLFGTLLQFVKEMNKGTFDLGALLVMAYVLITMFR